MIKLQIISTQDYKSKSGLDKNDLCDVQIGVRNVPLKDWPVLKKKLLELLGDSDKDE